MSSNETIPLSGGDLPTLTVVIEGDRLVRAVLDSGATVSLVNKKVVNRVEVRKGRRVNVQDYCGNIREYGEWCDILLRIGNEAKNLRFLVVEELRYDMLVSRAAMKDFKLNLHYDDTVSFGEQCNYRFEMKGNAYLKRDLSSFEITNMEDVKKFFPGVVSATPYPEPVRKFAVPFLLNDNTPVCRKPYALSRAKLQCMEKELEEMVKHGIVRESSSPYGSPCTMVPKTDGSWRFVTDYRLVNQKTDLLSWPLPRIDEIISETGGCKIFSTIDLLKGYWQQPLTEDTKRFSAFVTPFGAYEYNVNPFGWKNAPKHFQKMMDDVMRPHRGYARAYVDDIIVFSKSEAEHQAHIKKVLQSLEEASLKINVKKSELMSTSVVFLGRKFDGTTKSTKDESVERVRSMLPPENIKQLRTFLGLCGHFRMFIRDYAKIVKPLTELTGHDVPFNWGKVHQAVFEELKILITSNPIVSLPDFKRQFILTTDASDVGTGAVLSQVFEDGRERVVGYHSYTLTSAEANYTTSEKEALAVLKAVEYFHSFLDEQKFVLKTDHSALREILSAKQPKGRIARWLDKLSELEYDIVHTPGTKIPHADALSRLPVDTTIQPVLSVVEGRVEVDKEGRRRILKLYHDSPHSGGHDGIWRTYLKIAKRFTWPSMRKEVDAYVRSCDVCQRNKAKFRPKPDAMVIQPEVAPMHTLHLDFAELEKKREGVNRTKSFLVAIDRNTRFAFAKACRENAKAVVQMLSQNCFKNVKRVILDRAKVFESRELRIWALERGIQIQAGSPYHPESNGLAERFIRDLKMFISMYPDFPGGWKCALEAAVRHHNRSHCSSLGCSPEFALRGTVPILQADKELGIIETIQLRESRDPQKERLVKKAQKTQFDKRRSQKFPKIGVGDEILVRTGLPPHNKTYGGPYVVKKIESFDGVPKRFFYEDDGKERQVSLRNTIQYIPRRE